MIKKKRLLIYASSLFLITTGMHLKLNKNKSADIATEINEYTKDFTTDDFQIAAHRGFSSKEIENTKASIKASSEKEYIDYIEIDARMTKNQKIILSHNSKINSSILSNRNISDTNFEDLEKEKFKYYCQISFKDILNSLSTKEGEYLTKRKLSLNNKTFQISSLLEGLNEGRNKKIILDIKFSKNIKEFTNTLIEELKDIDTSNILFQSSNLLGILYFEEHTNYNCSAIIDEEKDLQYIPLFKNITIRKNLIDYDTINSLLKENKKVAIWTINTSLDLDKVTKELDNLYKDVIYITDNPDLIATKLHEKELKKEFQTY